MRPPILAPIHRQGWPFVALFAAATVLLWLFSGFLGWVGVLLVVYSLIALTPWRPRVPRRAEPWTNPLIGLASGAVAGSTGVAAVPFLPYMQSLDMDRHELVQALGIMFVFITGMLAVSLALHGAYHLTNSLSSLAAIAPTMAGVWLGQKARRRLSPRPRTT